MEALTVIPDLGQNPDLEYQSWPDLEFISGQTKKWADIT